MPKTTKSGKPIEDELPSTLQRSDAKAKDTYAQTHDSAVETYDGDEQAANRVAWGAVKHTHEKVGDHWQPKAGDAKGPSDQQSAKGGRDTDLDSEGGVDANASKEHLYDLAQDADIEGRSTMTKDELAKALQKANDKATRAARS